MKKSCLSEWRADSHDDQCATENPVALVWRAGPPPDNDQSFRRFDR